MHRIKFFLGGAVIFCVVGFSGVLFAGGREPDLKRAPSFTLQDLEGKTVSLEDFLGKVVYLDFWGSWCPPCIEELPHLEALYDAYHERGLAVVGISLGDSKRSLKRFMETHRIPYVVVLGNDKVIQDYQGVIFLPTAFIVDRKGFIRRKLFGYKEKEEIEQIVLPLLEEK